jgi:nucleotide-binding universal stress UspA family protein
MSPILLATDLSPWCDRAKQRALWLARREGAPLRVLFAAADEDLAGRARHELEAMLAAEAPDLDSTVIVRLGAGWEEIAAEVHTVRPRLVILGRHRRDSLKDFFFGSTASLLDGGPPTLQAVNMHAGPWRRAVVATDFSPLAQRALEVAADLAHDAELHLLHVFDMPFGGFISNAADTDATTARHRQELERSAAAAAAAAGARPVALDLARGAVVPTLSAEVARLGADLLVLGTGGGGGHDFGSTASALTDDPPCDLLVVPPSVLQ